MRTGLGVRAGFSPTLSAWLLRSARRRLKRRYADWGEAMAVEEEACRAGSEQLRWAVGCWAASLRSGAPDWIGYKPALGSGLALMTAYEWSADESLVTVLVLSLIAVALGLLRPQRVIVSGTSVGMVVAAVMAFEALSGVRPAYETQEQTLGDCLRWTILLAPSLIAAMIGGEIGRRLRFGDIGR